MNESTHFDAVRQARRITEQAVGWYIEQQEPLSERQRAAFLDWLRASPNHVAEYFAVVQMHGDMKAAAALKQITATELVEQARRDNPIVMFPHMEKAMPEQRPVHSKRSTRSRHLLAGAASIAALALVWLGMAHWRTAEVRPQQARMEHYAATDTAQSLALADGTLIHLDRNSDIDVRFDDRYRRIEVRRGHALFDVGKDPARPMLVNVGGHVLQDIGTIFEVRRDSGGDTLTVISGRVRVLDAQKASSKGDDLPLPGVAIADLSAGQQIELDASGASPVHPAQIAQTTAWLPANISFEHETIANVARSFNAYTSTPLEIEGEQLAQKRISGVFHADNPQAFVAYLSTLPNVRIIRDADRIRVVSANQTETKSGHL
ncbi:FecR family protein [Dyella flagellata]|uniref:Sensor n=1 Tax=Dyella flagellata TaxID=1867833 RepID=A0ABQ5X9L3_9GAMM|nr:FecR domain-containing protein [Dyella flagellata]GLQ88361.1 sensor [Dyella flagellata]